jgi:putative radical SAM enzyme (TIGR03279 family)
MSFVPVVNPGARQAGHPGTVLDVLPGSLAEKANIAAGDVVLSINGHPLRDPIDYRFYIAEDRVILNLRRGDQAHAVRLRKHPDQDLGLVLPELTLEDISECDNHCPFCFVTQLPKGMRSTLHIKDDDYRFSFLNASFVTLTNLSEDDWRRIGEQRLSPLYLSVHSTNPDLRRRLLGNKRAPDILEQIDRLIALGIEVHTQLVLCPGINDTDDLHSTTRHLLDRRPMLRTISAVPVGLTRVRTERTASSKNPLRRFRPDEALRVIRELQPYQKENVKQCGEPVVFLSDEFYLLANRRVPARSHYTDLSILDNGVGMVRMLLDAWRAMKRTLPPSLPTPRRLTLACGTLIAPILAPIAAELSSIPNLRVDLTPIENRLFGSEVTVSGLIVAADLLGQLAGKDLGDVVVLPRVMFDRAGEVTLDDFTRERISSELGRPIHLAEGVGDLERLIG